MSEAVAKYCSSMHVIGEKLVAEAIYIKACFLLDTIST